MSETEPISLDEEREIRARKEMLEKYKASGIRRLSEAMASYPDTEKPVDDFINYYSGGPSKKGPSGEGLSGDVLPLPKRTSNIDQTATESSVGPDKTAQIFPFRRPNH